MQKHINYSRNSITSYFTAINNYHAAVSDIAANMQAISNCTILKLLKNEESTLDEYEIIHICGKQTEI